MKKIFSVRVLVSIAGLGLLVAACQSPAQVRSGMVHPNFQVQPAKELPNEGASFYGVVINRNGNTLSVEQRADDNGFSSGLIDPLMNVIITGDTTLYHDTTWIVNHQQPPREPVQQTVAPGTIDAINTNSRVTVWGTVMLSSDGNYVTAKLLVYTDPTAFSPPQP